MSKLPFAGIVSLPIPAYCQIIDRQLLRLDESIDRIDIDSTSYSLDQRSNHLPRSRQGRSQKT